LSADGKLAGADVLDGTKSRWKVFDLATGKLVYDLPLDVSDNSAAASSCDFSPDGRALVESVLRDGSHTILYQPLDGSAGHSLVEPVQESIRDFHWSPSGKELAVLRLKSSSDVVLIRDQEGKKRR
jgi:Tol biopolymer transport system component